MTLFRKGLPIAAAMAMGLVACGDDPSTPVAGEAFREIAADQIVYGTETHLTADGVRTGVIRADSAYVYVDSLVNHLFGVEMTLFDERGETRATLTSLRAVTHQRSEQMVARGNVILVVPGRGVTVESPELHYDPGSERIWSDSATTFRQDGQTLRGTCFQSDLEFTNRTVCQPVGAIRGGAPEGSGGS